MPICADRPTALAALGQVPAIEGDDGLDVAGAQRIDETPIVVQAGFADCALAIGLHAGPGDGEAVNRDTELCHELDVRVDSVVVIASNVAIVPVVHSAGIVGESVPDRPTLPVVAGGTFYLICGRRDSPEKALREDELIAHRSHGLPVNLDLGHFFKCVSKKVTMRCRASKAACSW